MTGYFKTALLMAAMTALFMAAGALIGGTTGAVIALVIAGAMNLMTWWGSDKAVLSMTGARLVTAQTAPNSCIWSTIWRTAPACRARRSM